MIKLTKAFFQVVKSIGYTVWHGVKETLPNVIIGFSVGAAIIGAAALLIVFILLLACFPLQIGAAILIINFFTYKPTRK